MTAPAASPWSPLRQATFRWLWLASIASNIGTWMHEVGAGWLMTSLSASPLNVALVQVAGSLPMFFLALPAGALADIVDKRRYLLGVQLWMALVATLLASLTLLQLTSVWLLLGLTLCMGIGTALMMPAWSATTPELVGKDELPAAVALSSVGVNLARAVGPAIAGVLVSLVGPWLTFALNALSFFAVIAVLLAWKREAVPSVLPAERLFGALRAGWRYSRSSRPLQSVLVRAVAFFLGASAGMSLLPLIVRGELHGNAMDFGLLLGSVGVGAVLGAAFLPRLRERLGSDRLVLLSSVLYALVLVALALLRNLYLLVPVMLLSGAAWIAVLSSLQVAAQTFRAGLGPRPRAGGLHPGVLRQHGRRRRPVGSGRQPPVDHLRPALRQRRAAARPVRVAALPAAGHRGRGPRAVAALAGTTGRRRGGPGTRPGDGHP